MQTPIHRFPHIDAERPTRLASRLILLLAFGLLALLVGQMLSVLPKVLAETQHSLDRFAVELLLGLLERFAPQLGNFL
jgi:hypothetical protein